MLRDYHSKAAIDAAGEQEWAQYTSAPVMVCLADVEPEPIDWLWPGRFARGKVSLIAGDPGLGKSLFTLDMTARVTSSGTWPVDGSKCPRGDVILLSAEDDPADTIRPRLDTAGGDVKHVHLLEAIREANPDGTLTTRSFSLRRDLEQLSDELARRPRCVLVIVDPISAYLDGADSHNNADIRSLLAPLAKLAMTHKVAVVCVTHLNKGGHANAMYRTTGSLAFVAAARAVWAVTEDREDKTRKLVLPVKNNLSAERFGLAFRVRSARPDVPVIEWEPDPVTITAEEALAHDPDEARSEREEAAEWLRDVLASGAVETKSLRGLADKAGHSWRTVRRAKDALGIKARKQDFNGSWVWELPKAASPSEDVHPQRVDTLGHVGHLGGPTAREVVTNSVDSLMPCPACGEVAHWRVQANGGSWHCCKCQPADSRLGRLEFAEAGQG